MMSDILISHNPATGEELLRQNSFDIKLLPDVVSKARQAQVAWAEKSLKERMSHLQRAHTYLLENADSIAKTISLNNGKPLVEALCEVLPMVQTISFLKKRAGKILRPQNLGWTITFPSKRSYLTYGPLGLVGIIAPWNYPLSTPLAEVFFALAAGNAVILKPSDVTGLINEEIEKIVASMQLPPGVFHLLHGKGDVGAALVQASLDKLIVTGSVKTGQKIMAAASQHLTPLTLELGGKDAMIIFDDVNIDVAASAVVTGGFYNAGQTCCSVERLIVHEKIASQLIDAVTTKVQKLRIAESKDFNNDIGPITFHGQKEVYLAQTKAHQKSNQKTYLGAADYDVKSNFMRPLMVEGASGEAFWDEETFGPVIAVKTFSTDEEALALHNKTEFGLTAMIYSKNLKRAKALAAKLRAGTVVINDGPFTNAVPSLPWGGVGHSGFGWVHGEMGLKEMCRAQVLNFDMVGQFKQFWWYPHSYSQYHFFKNYMFLIEKKGVIGKLQSLVRVILYLIKMGPRL